MVFAVGAVVAGLITLSALGRFRLEADRTTNLLTISHKTPFGGGSQTLPLATLAGAEVTSRRSSGSSPNYRCEVVLTNGARWPLGRAFGAATPARAAADAINAWVGAGPARKA